MSGNTHHKLSHLLYSVTLSFTMGVWVVLAVVPAVAGVCFLACSVLLFSSIWHISISGLRTVCLYPGNLNKVGNQSDKKYTYYLYAVPGCILSP